MQTTSEPGAYWNAGGPKIYSQADIDSAISAGILTPDDARNLCRHVVGTAAAPVADEEYFRLVGGLNDIFVVIACLLLLTATGVLVGQVSSALPEQIGIGLAGLMVAATSWGLAEHFVRKKRLALSSIVLLLSFLGGVALGMGVFAAEILQVWNLGPFDRMNWLEDKPYDASRKVFSVLMMLALVCIPVGIAAWFHWKRFRVPITVAAGVGIFLGLTLMALVGIFPALEDNIPTVCLVFGLMTLALAMVWDSQDTLRQTRKSDVAFWLHLLSAPLLVHPVFMYAGVFDGDATMLQAALIVALYVGIALVSIGIDRRALMVSALAYVLFALGTLFREFGAVGLDFAVSALLVGGLLLVLSAFWQTVRAWVVTLLPAGLQRNLPPIRI